MLGLGVLHWRIEEDLSQLQRCRKLGKSEFRGCYGKLSAAVFSDEFGAKFAGECQLKINLYSVYGLPVTVAEGLYVDGASSRYIRTSSPWANYSTRMRK